MSIHPLLANAMTDEYYFQDHKQQWKFYYSSNASHRLLKTLLQRISPAMTTLEHAAPTAMQEGEQIYRKKPSKDGEGTWSQEEYAHYGLQREYIRFKSFQRFTETYNAMERCNYILNDVFRNHKGQFIVASLGGGPGIELFAVYDFFKRHHPHLVNELRLVSLDLEPSWQSIIESFAPLEMDFFPPKIEFYQWDCQAMDANDILVEKIGHIHLGILSYVLHHHFQPPHCIPNLASLLHTHCDALLVNGRDEQLPAETRQFSQTKVRLVRLISQQIEHQGEFHEFRDDRQWLLLPNDSFCEEALPRMETLYPNVPYEEHKKPKKRVK
jgi:hypothetical protein